jgi:hypothetical protein
MRRAIPLKTIRYYHRQNQRLLGDDLSRKAWSDQEKMA